jgi:hypothetical protein
MNDRAKMLIRSGVSKDQFQARLQLDDFGWERSVSTVAFLPNIGRYYDEMAAAK